jgi:alkylation response protein AidB-like acyl-CoA dehydrogenase
MVHAANMAFGLCPMLSEAAIEALSLHGTARQKAIFLPRLVSGAWTGTMNLTEPQAGSDLSLVQARAEPDGEGGYRLTGQKIYITWGDHDLAENIVHLVLARLPDAPSGVRGISLFLASKRLVDEDGGLGPANAVRAGSIEHKLGIRASPTCVMLFEGARAELVGQPNQGLAHMFTMMNAARLNVGVEGVGLGERAFQQALAYACERRQGRSPWSADPVAAIVDLPDVRRMLTLIKAKVAAARGLCFSTAVAADLALHGASPEARARARRREEFLTPLAKAWSTDVGVEAASLGVQVHGGMGFIEETGAAQHYRDARIAPIYEGTNGIQAVDLVGRKLALEGGLAFDEFLEDVRAGARALEDEALAGVGARLLEASDAAERAGRGLSRAKGDPGALAGACAFLELLASTFGGLMLAREAAAATLPEAKAAKTALARFYADQVLSAAEGLERKALAGAADLQVLTPERLRG